MTASAFLNRVRMSVSGTPGTGAITLGSAVSAAFATADEAGAVDATKYTYLIEDGNDFEIGQGTYTASGTTLSRDTVYLSKISGVAGTTKLTLTSAAIISITVAKEDMPVGGTREKLTADRTYYVRSDGSNSNTGLVDSSGGAFLTIPFAYNYIAANLDLAGFTVTIRLSKSGDTFTSGLTITKPWVGGGALILQGYDTTPTNSLISTTSASAIAVSCALPGKLTIKDLKLQAATAGSCLDIGGPGIVEYQNINFGACPGSHVAAQVSGVTITATGNYAISGGAESHFRAQASGCVIKAPGRTITLSGTPAFGSGFADALFGGAILVDSMTFSGSATGPRYRLLGLSSIYTQGGGANYFPGNSAGSGGTTSGNGYYA